MCAYFLSDNENIIYLFYLAITSIATGRHNIAKECADNIKTLFANMKQLKGNMIARYYLRKSKTIEYLLTSMAEAAPSTLAP